MRGEIVGIALALAGALLFGLVGVAAKGTTLHPLVKGGAAYLLAGAALAATLRGLRIERRDWPMILVMSLAGGSLAPALLFFGIERTTAVTASILLTLEMVFTAILAAIFLRERMRPRVVASVALLFLAAILAGIPTADAGQTTLMGALLVALAALFWGVDNTLSAKLVGAYKPHHLVALKGLVGGSAALAVALALGARMEMGAGDVVRVAFIGLLGIGASIVLFYHALRYVGATLTSAVFLPASAVAGVLGGAILLGEPVAWNHVGGVALALAGLGLLTRRHAPQAPLPPPGVPPR